MEETSIIERLIHFGLSRQDAIVYLCLLKSGELSGYEVAKLTSISRSNVYSTLSGLVEHGAAYLIEGGTSKYVAVPLEEFCEDHIRRLQADKDYIKAHGPKQAKTVEGYVTVEGVRHVMDKIHNMLTKVEQRVYFSASCSFLEQWKSLLTELAKQNKKVVLITDEKPSDWVTDEMIIYLSEESKHDQIRLIVDSTQVLTGTVTNDSANCLFCGQENFVNVFKEAMRNEILLIELKGHK